ncbi:MAG: hypothetical protein JW937_10045 [Candidatus Omnitrophica bacterium]|nr:hypothetical protein [Candidatus Omnitrophota bacterium]
MSAKANIRKWCELDWQQIWNELLVVGQLSGSCGKCRALGVELTAHRCPECGTGFKYAAIRLEGGRPGDYYAAVKRLRQNRPELTLLELADLENARGQAKSREIFG